MTFIKLKLYKLETDTFGGNPKMSSDLFAKVIIKEKQIIKSELVGKNQSTDINRYDYNIDFMDKYHRLYKKDYYLLSFKHKSLSLTTYFKPTLFQRFYFKAIFEQFLIQRITGLKRTLIEIFVGILLLIIGKLL